MAQSKYTVYLKKAHSLFRVGKMRPKEMEEERDDHIIDYI